MATNSRRPESCEAGGFPFPSVQYTFLRALHLFQLHRLHPSIPQIRIPLYLTITGAKTVYGRYTLRTDSTTEPEPL
jgi:hypothetical protein